MNVIVEMNGQVYTVGPILGRSVLIVTIKYILTSRNPWKDLVIKRNSVECARDLVIHAPMMID